MHFVVSLLRDVPDPRTGNEKRHSLLDVLTIALVASICGCESCVEFADCAENREDLFREFLALRNGLPSHDTFSQLFRLLDPDAFAASDVFWAMSERTDRGCWPWTAKRHGVPLIMRPALLRCAAHW